MSILGIIGVRHCGHVDDTILSLYKLSTCLLLLLSLYLTLYVFLWLFPIIAALCMSYSMCLFFSIIIVLYDYYYQKVGFLLVGAVWWFTELLL